MRNYLLAAFVVAFFLLGLNLFLESQPQQREKRVYNILKEYIPYKIEKKLSGLYIRDLKTDEKLEPKNSEIFHLLDNLEKDWGEKHLYRDGDRLIVVDDDNKTLKIITLQNDNERRYIKEFFGK